MLYAAFASCFPGEAQTLLALAQERERAATEKLAEMTSRCVALEATNAQLRHDKAQLLTHQESDRRRIDTLEERKARYEVCLFHFCSLFNNFLYFS